MTESYEDFEREYNSYLSRIRSVLAGNRSLADLQECERLLSEAKKSATAMQGLAEVEGNPLKIRESVQRVERDIDPLAKEVQRALNSRDRSELFYHAPEGGSGDDMESLISNSENLLRESQALCMETEQIGNSTLLQMGQQREQLQNASSNIDATREIARHAGLVLADMSRKAFRNKFCLYIMIGLLIVGNFLALRRLFRNGN